MNTLNERQKRVYEYIKNYILEKNYAPSVRDICRGAKVKSTSTAHNDIKVLIEAGLLRKDSQKSRTLELVFKQDYPQDPYHQEETIDVPILGRVAAGEPIFAEENIDFYFPIPSYYSRKGDLFMLTISGESMIEAGILDGDKVLVKKQDTCENGDIVVALIDDSATVKRFYKDNKRVMLMPENSAMEPIIPENLMILGKVIALFRDNI